MIVHQPRFRRPKQLTRMELTPRDVEIVRAVSTYRVLSQAQLQRLFFGTKSAAQRVLLRLYRHGYLDRKFLPVVFGRSPTLYVLDKQGAALLRTTDPLDQPVWYASSKDLKSEFLQHTLAINDLRIAVTLAARQEGFELVQWVGENALKAHYDRVSVRLPNGQSQAISLIPDSYFILKTPYGYAHFFLEVDRGTENLDRFKRKVLAYLAYYQSGRYTQRYGSQSMRVLTVAPGERRLQGLKTATEASGGKRAFWFGLADALSPETILKAAVWQVAGEVGKRALID